MTFEEFVEELREGVDRGEYSVKDSLNLMTEKGHRTSKDIPEKDRGSFLTELYKSNWSNR